MIDELAERAGADPVEFRLRHVADIRAQDLMRRVAAVAGWQAQTPGSRGEPGADGLLRGRGFAYARYVHSAFPGVGAAWAAWVIDLTVDPTTGGVTIGHVVVGQDTGMMVNPDGVRHQIHGNVIQTLSRVLREEVMFDRNGVSSRDWGLYPIMSFCELPSIEVVLMERQSEEPLGAGESASVPGPAAVANALFDATGLRFRKAPFTPEKIRAALFDSVGGARPTAQRTAHGATCGPGGDAPPTTRHYAQAAAPDDGGPGAAR
jgi:isoquinoline 1-oxidoreductase